MCCRPGRMLRQLATVRGLLVWLALPGCSDTGPRQPGDQLPRAADPATQQAPSSAAAASSPDHEIWEVHFLQGSRFGYGRTTVRHETRSGRPTVRIEAVEHHSVKRQGQATNLESRLSSIETPDGKLLEFQFEIKMGPSPARTTGRVVGQRLHLETTTQGKTVASEIAWSPEWGGPYAVNLSLWRSPMQPGQQRTVNGLLPELSRVGTSTLTAKDFEPVRLLAGTYRLLQIEDTVRLPDGQELRMVHWADRSGDILKTRIEPMGLEVVRATKEIALEETELPDLDLITDVAIPVDRPLPQAHHTKRVRYRVRLDGGDPAKEFAVGASQQVRSIDPHTAEVTVYAIRPGQSGGNPDAPADPPADADRRPNNMIQSDDPRVVADAAAAAGQETDPWKVAVALDQYVHREIAVENFSFSQAFATAAEVAKTREGDCSENAVYLAALARARGIPARMAIGLVYMQHRQALGYHMWTEMYLDGRWIPLDATLGQGGIGGGHLKIGQSPLEDASAYSSFLPLARLLGRLRIEVLERE